MTRDPIMQVLLDHELITQDDLDSAILATQGSNTNWLEQLVLLRRLDEDAYCRCLSRVLLVPQCDSRRLANIPREALVALPLSVIVEYQVMPVFVDREGDLHVAMVQPIDSLKWEEIQFFANSPGRLMRSVVGPTTMAWAQHHYFDIASNLWPTAQHRPQALVIAA